MSGPAISVTGISVTRGQTVAVDQVSLEVGHGIWFGLIGANGSGKTSLLRALAGRLPCSVESCRIQDQELANRPAERAQRLGYMPTADALPSALTCRQIFDLVGVDEASWRAGIADVGTAIGLDRLLDRRIGDCSAGMRQRVAIGCAFASNKALVVLDEPFNWLDPVAAYDLRLALRRRVESGVTLITALHDMLALVACDEGLLLGEGKVAAEIGRDSISAGRLSPATFEPQMIETLRRYSRPT